MSDDHRVDAIWAILFDGDDGLPARLLVAETELARQKALLEAMVFALNGDTRTKGLVSTIRELDDERKKKAETKQWAIRDIFVGGVVVALLMELIRFALARTLGG